MVFFPVDQYQHLVRQLLKVCGAEVNCLSSFMIMPVLWVTSVAEPGTSDKALNDPF